MLNKGYARRPPPIKKVNTIVFYNVPDKYNTYKSFHQDHKSNLRIISLVSNEESLKNLLRIENKMDEQISRMRLQPYGAKFVEKVEWILEKKGTNKL